MNNLYSLIAVGFLATAGTLSARDPDVKPDPTDDVSVPDRNASAMIGTYVGDFGKRKITISLDRVIGKTVSGYSIVAGNERAFSGSWEAIATGFKILAKEPGDDPSDGYS